MPAASAAPAAAPAAEEVVEVGILESRPCGQLLTVASVGETQGEDCVQRQARVF